MSREVRRMALDFDWPLRIPFSGGDMPDDLQPTTCDVCSGKGLSAFGERLEDLWWGRIPFSPEDTGSKPHTPDTPGMMEHCRDKIMDSRAFYDPYHGSKGEETVLREAVRLCALWNNMWQHHLSAEDVDALLADDRILEGLTHRYDRDGWIPLERPRPTVEEVNIWTLRLNGCGPLSMSAGAIFREAAARAGEDARCGSCGGEGVLYRDDGHRSAYDAWTPAEPPAGPGYQVWETVSSGSPVSPVFLKPDDLAAWMTENTRTEEDAVGYAVWLDFIKEEGYAPTGTLIDGIVVSGMLGYASLRAAA